VILLSAGSFVNSLFIPHAYSTDIIIADYESVFVWGGDSRIFYEHL